MFYWSFIGCGGNIKVERVKGMRDYDFEDMLLRERVRSIINRVYKSFGFFEMDTPALEKYEILVGKEVGAGEEIKKEIYQFKDNKGRRIGLRFDMTVPLMRYLGMNTNLKMPFKRQQYGKVWRYEDFKKGRYREFYQYDIDIVGSKNVEADFECVWAASVSLNEIFKDYGLRVKFFINNRMLIEGILGEMGFEGKEEEIMRVLDKIRKMDEEVLLKEFEEKGVSREEGERILKEVDFSGNVEELEEYLKSKGFENEKVKKGFKDLKRISELLKGRAIDFVIDFSIVRGLGYYTGNVFESYVEGYEGIGSVCSGGRYDGAGKFANKDLPSVGISIGVDRVLDILKDKSEDELRKDYYVIRMDGVSDNYFFKVVEKLRKNYSVEYDLLGRSFSKNMKYASDLGFMYVIVLGKKEEKEGKISVKDMDKGEQRVLSFDEFF